MPKLKHNRLLEQLAYDPVTGVFKWQQKDSFIKASSKQNQKR